MRLPEMYPAQAGIRVLHLPPYSILYLCTYAL